MRRGGAVLGLLAALVLLPAAPASAQELLPLPSPTSEEPSPEPSPTAEPEEQPSPSPSPRPVRSPSPRTMPSPVVTSVAAAPSPSPTPAAVGATSVPSPLASVASVEPPAEEVASPQVNQYVRWALALAALLGLAGGAGLYWTRSHP